MKKVVKENRKIRVCVIFVLFRRYLMVNMLELEMYGVLIDLKRFGLFMFSINKVCLGDLCKLKFFMEKLKS